ncbi:hypothetical protein TorRG33x02_309100 [Trema orientale]|uniref:Uncharacterized protein n=1 Tax=Trema orientale TaxID=63057 RepID=A0A2P5BTQ1_TREOI|nr:hypothetical protein TorRG33x02_309100 [Trema orientale]
MFFSFGLLKLDDWVLCRMYKNKGFGKRIKSREDKGITQNGSNRVQTFPPEKKMRNKKKKNNNNKTTPSIDHNQERKEGGISDSNINNNNNNNNGTNFPSTSKQQAIDQHNMVSEDFSTIISSGNENVAAPTGLSSNTPGAITTPATLTGLSSNISGAITTPGALTGLSSNTSGSSTIPAASGDNRLHPERVSQRDEPYHQMTTQQNDNDIELMKVYGELPPLTEVRPSNNIDDDLYFKLERIIGDEFPSSREAFLQDGDPTWPWPPPSCSGK